MIDRSYGSSGYIPTHHYERKAASASPHRIKNPFFRKILKLFIGAILIALFLAWLLLGEFRFMLWRYPGFSGLPFGDRSYLVLFQNNYELRPTGGFISTYGILHFNNGFYNGLDFFDVYGSIDDHEYVEPPLILSALLSGEGYQGHTFRDANFDPDFRLSKDELVKFYQMTHPDEDVDGIFAIDFSFLERLVALYEPLEVEGYRLSESNLFETLSTVVSDIDRHSEEALAERKSITAPLVQKIITKTLILPWRVNGFLETLAQGFEEKHVLAAFNRRGLQKSYHKRHWDGALPQSDSGDFLAINEANYGGMKSDRYISRDVTYTLELTGERDVLGNPVLEAMVAITLTHHGTWNTPLSGPYTGYLRTLIPLGSRIEEGSDITEDREDSAVLGEILQLEPGESKTFTYRYELPEYVWDENRYYLHLHKQPGTLADHYRVVVKLPQGSSMESDYFDIRENIGFFETNLITDVNLSFGLLDDENPPRIVSHELTDLNETTIVFNEPLNVEHAADPLNYKIIDTNFKNETVTDDVRIVNIRVDGSAVILTTEGMTEQLEERYEVVLQGLTDTHGNVITPNPRTVTVVQRSLLSPTLETDSLSNE